MQKRNFYRAGWIKFKDGADMTTVIDRLGDEKVCFGVFVSYRFLGYSHCASHRLKASSSTYLIQRDPSQPALAMPQIHLSVLNAC